MKIIFLVLGNRWEAEFLIDVLMTAPFLVKWKFRGAMPLNFHV